MRRKQNKSGERITAICTRKPNGRKILWQRKCSNTIVKICSINRKCFLRQYTKRLTSITYKVSVEFRTKDKTILAYK